jgi:hypothetical protein
MQYVLVDNHEVFRCQRHALKSLSINPYHTIGDETGEDWAVTIGGEEKVWRFEDSDAKIVKTKIEDSKKLLGAKINVVNTKTGEISAT